MPRAHASRLAEAALAPLLDSLAEHLSYCLVETATELHWTTFPPGGATAQAVRGRAFGSRCDVQFRRQDAGFEVTVLTDVERLALPEGESLDLGDLDSDEALYILWGERPPGAAAWSERGFRQRWQYPVEGAPRRVAIRAQEYRDRDTGELQFVRYRALVPVEDEG